MTTSHDLTTKKKIVDVIQRMPEDATIDDAIYRLNLLKAVAEGLRDVEAGRVYDHDELFDEIDAKNNTISVERAGGMGRARINETHRKRLARKRGGIRAKTKASHQ